MNTPLCCHMYDPLTRCAKPAVYQVWPGYEHSLDNYTECCADHLADMLEPQYDRFQIFRIEKKEAADGPQD